VTTLPAQPASAKATTDIISKRIIRSPCYWHSHEQYTHWAGPNVHLLHPIYQNCNPASVLHKTSKTDRLAPLVAKYQPLQTHRNQEISPRCHADRTSVAALAHQRTLWSHEPTPLFFEESG